MTSFPFIGKSCTVGAALGRELIWMSGNIQLLMLERMHLLGIGHTLDSSTLQGTARHLGRLRNFSRKYGIDIFLAALIAQLPRSAVIPLLLWGGIGVYSPDIPEDGGGQVQHCQEPPFRGLCLSPLGENASIPRSHVPGRRQYCSWGLPFVTYG
jgi:hypothetical protein